MADILPSTMDTERTDKKLCKGFAKEITQTIDEKPVNYSEKDEEFLPACDSQFESLNETNSQDEEYPSGPLMTSTHDDEDSPYQTNLFSYDDTEYYPNYHFGLIRGYHREMYEEKPKEQQWFHCCSLDRETVRRIKRRNRVLSWQVMGILFGAVFVFFGIASLIISFLVSSDETRDYFWRSIEIPSLYIHIIAIVGLTILTLGSALVSLCLLVPTLLGRLQGAEDMPVFWCTTGDLYIKNAEKMAQNQFLYFDAAVYGNFVGNSNVKKIQPELTNGNEQD